MSDIVAFHNILVRFYAERKPSAPCLWGQSPKGEALTLESPNPFVP